MAMPIPSAHSCPDTDVLVIGRGVSAWALSVLLAQRGWLVTLADPSGSEDKFPRVVGLDSATLRVLSNCGIGRVLAGIGVPGTELELRGPILRFQRGPFTMFRQSGLESALATRASRLPNLQILHGRAASLLVDHGGHASSLIGFEPLTSSWIVSCDGRHSFHGHLPGWRSGRILLPVRPSLLDVSTLSWQLDLVLRGRADGSLLDTFPLDGPLLPSAIVESPDVRGPLDEVLGPGFVLLALDEVHSLGRSRRAFLDDLGCKVVRVLPAGSPARPGAVVDTENVYVPFLMSSGARTALIRPDHYVFGFADTPSALVDDLRSQLFQARPLE
ncbi:FAD-dependent monooxygenase [Lentzea sp. NPDC051838]|uniref:FAD-dependent monooxygenase n=1 Tax=Lentzea sp. NPDC051838 TaxID=3154849 RepID=UPI003438AEDA